MTDAVVGRVLMSPTELGLVSALFEDVWGDAAGSVPAELMRAIGYCGGVTIGAFRGRTLVGAGVALLAREAPDSSLHLHSHAVAVRSDARRLGVGRRIKECQRTWALEHNLHAIKWTFDPLQSGNAAFNLVSLGAEATVFLANFYGRVEDDLNSGPTDRLLVKWDLDALPPRIDEPLVGIPPLVAIGPGQRPTQLRSLPQSGLVTLAVPGSIDTLRTEDPRCAEEWRSLHHGYFGELSALRGRVRGYRSDVGYLLETAAG